MPHAEVPWSVPGVSVALAISYVGYVRFHRQVGQEIDSWLTSSGDEPERAATNLPADDRKKDGVAASHAADVQPGKHAKNNDEEENESKAVAVSEREPDRQAISADVRRLVTRVDTLGRGAHRTEAVASFGQQMLTAPTLQAKTAWLQTLCDEKAMDMLLRLLLDRDPSVQAAALSSIETFVHVCLEQPVQPEKLHHEHGPYVAWQDSTGKVREQLLRDFLQDGLDVLLRVISSSSPSSSLTLQLCELLRDMASGNAAARKYLANNGALNVLMKLIEDQGCSNDVHRAGFQAISILRGARLQYRLDVAGGQASAQQRGAAAGSLNNVVSSRDNGNADPHTLHWHSQDPAQRKATPASDQYSLNRLALIQRQQTSHTAGATSSLSTSQSEAEQGSSGVRGSPAA